MQGIWKGGVSLKGSAEVIGAILILIGVVISFVSAIGLLRFPDVYTRAHASSKSATLGVLSILVGTLLYFLISSGHFSIRLILGIIFVFLTAPVASHLISRSAYRSGAALAPVSIEDELKAYMEERKIKENR